VLKSEKHRHSQAILGYVGVLFSGRTGLNGRTDVPGRIWRLGRVCIGLRQEGLARRAVGALPCPFGGHDGKYSKSGEPYAHRFVWLFKGFVLFHKRLFLFQETCDSIVELSSLLNSHVSSPRLSYHASKVS